MTAGTKHKLGLKKYLIFENVITTFDKKETKLASVMKASVKDMKAN